jgi:L-ascorbate metabolism protein UlaG (beta-lactamase superfamily)
MKVTKVGHACLLVEEGKLKVLIDPGNYNPKPEASGLDVILITHEHDDHCFLPVLQEVLKENPQAEVITHEAVGKKLESSGITWTPIKDGEVIDRKEVKIASYGKEHAIIHRELPRFANTGFMIAGRFFYPGDALYKPPVSVEILALPTAAPWMRVEESIDYGRNVKPKIAFPVHDGIMVPAARGFAKMLAPKFFAPLGIDFRDATEGTVLEF